MKYVGNLICLGRVWMCEFKMFLNASRTHIHLFTDNNLKAELHLSVVQCTANVFLNDIFTGGAKSMF